MACHSPASRGPAGQRAAAICSRLCVGCHSSLPITSAVSEGSDHGGEGRRRADSEQHVACDAVPAVHHHEHCPDDERGGRDRTNQPLEVPARAVARRVDVRRRQEVPPQGQHLAEVEEDDAELVQCLARLRGRRPVPLAADGAGETVARAPAGSSSGRTPSAASPPHRCPMGRLAGRPAAGPQVWWMNPPRWTPLADVPAR